MMHRCSSDAHGNMGGGPCSCSFFHSQNSSFSVLFNPKAFDEGNMYSFASSTSSSAVDCTLSLGTPSTRLSCDAEKRRSSSCMSNFCWDFFHSTNNQSNNKTSLGAASGGNSNFGGGEPLLARRCANCDTTSTPLWRNGPKGPKSLCNACGIRFKKEERRATAAAATNTTGGGAVAVDAQHVLNSSWVNHSQNQKVPYISSPYGNEFRFIEDDDRGPGTTGAAIPFLSWRLSVTDRPGLVHNLTM